MRKIIIALIAGAFLILAGCAASSVPKDHRLDTREGQGQGLVVFSVSHDLEGGRPTKAVFYVNGGPAERNGAAFFSLRDAVPGIPGGSDIDGYGKLYAYALPAGQHEVTRWAVNRGQVWVSPRGTLAPLRFDVKSGEVVYLGNLHVRLTMGRALIGVSTLASGRADVRDERERDLALFEAQFPQYKDQAKVDLLPLGLWLPTSGGAQRRVEPLPPPVPLPQS